jgi:hypothetical protein
LQGAILNVIKSFDFCHWILIGFETKWLKALSNTIFIFASHKTSYKPEKLSNTIDLFCGSFTVRWMTENDALPFSLFSTKQIFSRRKYIINVKLLEE